MAASESAAEIWGLPYQGEQAVPAHQIVDKLRRTHQLHTRRLEKVGLASLAYQDGRSAPGRYALASPQHRRRVPQVYREWVPLELWSRWKQVYVPHPKLSDTLLDAGCDEISGAFLHRLPYHDPVFVLPFGAPMTQTDGAPGIIRAFTVTGAHSVRYGADPGMFVRDAPEPSARIVTSTADRTVNSLSVQVISEVLDSRGAVQDINWGNFAIPILERFTLDSLIDGVANDFYSDVATTHVEEYVRGCMRTVLSHLLYAVSANADVSPVQRAPQRGKRGGGGASVAYHPLGYRIGAQLGLRRASESRTSGASTGRRMAPHLRRAHWHTYRTGPGRQEETLKFLLPIPVNATPEGLDDDAVPVLHQYI